MANEKKLLGESARRTAMDESYVGALTHKWGEFLEGMSARSEQDRYVKSCTAVLMENQSEWLQSLDEDTRSSNVGSFTKFIFPILRRVFPNLIAHEIVSVQPMTAPVGAVFYLDYVYTKAKGSVNTSAAGNGSGATFPDQFSADYTSEYVNGEPFGGTAGNLGVAPGTNWGGAGTAVPNFYLGGNSGAAAGPWLPVQDVSAGKGYGVTISEINSAGTVVQTAVMVAGGGSFTFTPAGGSTAGSVILASGLVSGFKFQNAPTINNLVKSYYYYNGEANSALPEMQLNVRQSAVEAVPRRLKALWSSEAAEDLRALHGVDAEAEMVATIAQEIALEIDREIIQDLYRNSFGTTATFDRTPPAGVSEIDHLRAMLTQISTVSNLIHKKTLRAPANWIVTSPEVSALLAQLTTHGDFRAAFSSDSSTPYGAFDAPRPLGRHGQFGVYKTGTLMNKWTVYEDPYFTRDRMLIGLKGEGFLNAGYAWAPYVPLQVTPSFLDPADMTIRKGLRTRYAKKLLRSEFYGSMQITGL